MTPTWNTKPSRREVVRDFLDVFTPPERIKCSEWALKYRRLSPEASAKSGGAFSFDEAPWQREVLDAPDDPEVSHTVLMWASQVTGKTETINNMIGYTIDIDPCPILMVMPTLELGEMWSKDRLAPMLRDTPRLRGKVREARSRDSGNTLLQKRFPGGDIAIAGANAPAGLASRPRRKVKFDEVDRYPPGGAGTEGDQITLGEKRTESYPDASIVMTSTPGIEGVSRIEKEFERSDKRYWFCPCPHCAEEQHLKWAQVKWLHDGVNPAEIWYECEFCLKPWTDLQRQVAIRAGRWKATAPFNGIRGYHLNGIYCLFRPKKPYKTRLQQFVADFLKAKAQGEQTLKAWTNTFLAETWKLKGLEVKPHDLMKRCKPWDGKLHPRCLVATWGGDVQAERIEVEFTGYGDGFESWGLGYHVLVGDTNDDAVWNALDNLLLSVEWDHPSGVKIKPAMGFLDLGFRPHRVVRFTRAREARNIHACAGNKTPWSVLCARPTRTTNRKAVKFQVGGDTAKEDLYARLNVQEEGPGFCHFPIGYNYDEEYFKQLTAEKLVTELDDRGMIKKKLFVKQRERNEALDIRCYGRAALEYLNPNWKVLARKLAVQPVVAPVAVPAGDPVEQPPAEQPNKPTPRPLRSRSTGWRSGGGFRGGWR